MIWTSWEHTLIRYDGHVFTCRFTHGVNLLPNGNRPFGRVRPWVSKNFLGQACEQIPSATVTAQPISIRTPPVSKAVDDLFVHLQQEFSIIDMPHTSIKRRVGHHQLSPVVVFEILRHQSRLRRSLGLQPSPSCPVVGNQRIFIPRFW